MKKEKKISFSNINKTENVWWFTIENEKLKNEYFLMLNNDVTKTIILIKLPGIDNCENYFFQKSVNGKPGSNIMIYVDRDKLIDKKGFDFTDYVIGEVPYPKE